MLSLGDSRWALYADGLATPNSGPAKQIPWLTPLTPLPDPLPMVTWTLSQKRAIQYYIALLG
jgi:hypothetical protein